MDEMTQRERIRLAYLRGFERRRRRQEIEQGLDRIEAELIAEHPGDARQYRLITDIFRDVMLGAELRQERLPERPEVPEAFYRD